MKKIDQSKRSLLIKEALRLLDRIDTNMEFLVEQSKAGVAKKKAA